VARTRRPDDQPPRARLFVALELPDEARAALVAWQGRALAGRADLRALAPEALHVTLAFLGHRPFGEIEAIGVAVGGAVDGLAPARLVPTGVRGVPRRRPRLFALDLADPDGRAEALQAAVSNALAGAGFYEPEHRRFWPHVTVARVGRSERQAAPITVPPPPDELTASEVVLYRSHLGRGPARYEALASFATR
jgi:RNA 2',3'-cyclic 3'-phosphodiesterase